VNVPAETVQLGDGDVTPALPCGCQCGLELWPAVQRVRALAGFYLHELADNLNSSALANWLRAVLWASMPKPERPCREVETRMYVIIALSVTSARLQVHGKSIIWSFYYYTTMPFATYADKVASVPKSHSSCQQSGSIFTERREAHSSTRHLDVEPTAAPSHSLHQRINDHALIQL